MQTLEKTTKIAPREGLDSDAVLRSRQKYGENVLPKARGRSFLRAFFSNLGDPVIKILIGALAINLIFLFSPKLSIRITGYNFCIAASDTNKTGFPDNGSVIRFPESTSAVTLSVDLPRQITISAVLQFILYVNNLISIKHTITVHTKAVG